ncbi:MAG: hypothetical protein LLF76_03745 [Planctomycetaceae bacterium]|nr:hypothetical protein [Planctomycetaceae bacterium]
MSNLIEIHNHAFSDNEVHRYLQWVEGIKVKGSNQLKDAYRKKVWLLPLVRSDKHKQNESVTQLYSRYDKICPAEPEHPGWLGWSESWSGYEEVLDKNEFISKTCNEQIAWLNDYKFEVGWRKPREEDLAYSFRQIVSEYPDKFASNLKSFLQLRRNGDKLALLQGFKNAWESGKIFSWDQAFEFCLAIVNESEFWTRKISGESYDYRRAFVDAISHLLIAGMGKENNTFDRTLLPQAKDLILLLAREIRNTTWDEHQPLGDGLNSINYCVFRVIVTYALFYAKTLQPKAGTKWETEIRDYFEDGLDKTSNPSLSFSFCVGLFLPQLRYLDQEWVDSNINRILPKEKDEHWKSAFDGYLTGGKRYKEIYLLLKTNGHYDKGLQVQADSKHLIQHICLGYLNGEEELGNRQSLIEKLLRKENNDIICEIVHYFHTFDPKIQRNLAPKIISLWRTVYNLLNNKTDRSKYAEGIRNLALWLDLVDRLDDEIASWLKFSVDYIHNSWDTHLLVGSLLKYVATVPKQVAEIYYYIVEKGLYPEFQEKDIQEIISELFERGQQDIGKAICNLYQSRGYEFLKGVREKYDSVQSTKR